MVGQTFYVAGGYSDVYLTSVEQLSLDTMDEWRPGPELPQIVEDASAAQYKDSLLLIGGEFESRDIFMLKPENPNEWIRRDEKLTIARQHHASIMVDPEQFNCI